MLNLVEFLLCVFGFFASVKVSIRRTVLDRKPLNCAVCMGFWVGWAFAPMFFKGHPWWYYQFYGFMASGASWIASKYVTGDY